MSLHIEKYAEELETPYDVQRHILTMSYNHEPDGETIFSAEKTLERHIGHCLETAFAAAALLERHGHPPLILSMESYDRVDHVVYIFKQGGFWGSIGRSREPGLQGRKPIHRSVRDLMWSYFDPYVDDTGGRLIAYQVFHLDETQADWRHCENNLWRIEQFLSDEKHLKLNSSNSRYKKLVERYSEKGPILAGPDWWY